MAVYTCRRCDYESDVPWTETCPGCGGFYRWKKAGVDSIDQKGQYTTLGRTKAKSQHQYISTGQPGFDAVLGGGLVAGRVLLLGGFEGTGKTRLLLTISDYLAKTQGRVIYASGEESEDAVNDTAAHLDLRNDQVIVIGNQRSIEKVLEDAKKLRAFLTVFDSAQKFTSDYAGGGAGSGSQCKAIGEAIRRHCSETKTCAIIVNQMSAGGELKSGADLKHECDTVAVLGYPKDDDENAPKEPGIRILDGSKNRLGPENVKSYWKMTAEGRLEHVPARSKLTEPAHSRYARRSAGN